LTTHLALRFWKIRIQCVEIKFFLKINDRNNTLELSRIFDLFYNRIQIVKNGIYADFSEVGLWVTIQNSDSTRNVGIRKNLAGYLFMK